MIFLVEMAEATCMGILHLIGNVFSGYMEAESEGKLREKLIKVQTEHCENWAKDCLIARNHNEQICLNNPDDLMACEDAQEQLVWDIMGYEHAMEDKAIAHKLPGVNIFSIPGASDDGYWYAEERICKHCGAPLSFRQTYDKDNTVHSGPCECREDELPHWARYAKSVGKLRVRWNHTHCISCSSYEQ